MLNYFNTPNQNRKLPRYLKEKDGTYKVDSNGSLIPLTDTQYSPQRELYKEFVQNLKRHKKYKR